MQILTLIILQIIITNNNNNKYVYNKTIILLMSQSLYCNCRLTSRHARPGNGCLNVIPVCLTCTGLFIRTTVSTCVLCVFNQPNGELPKKSPKSHFHFYTSQLCEVDGCALVDWHGQVEDCTDCCTDGQAGCGRHRRLHCLWWWWWGGTPTVCP